MIRVRECPEYQALGQTSAHCSVSASYCEVEKWRELQNKLVGGWCATYKLQPGLLVRLRGSSITTPRPLKGRKRDLGNELSYVGRKSVLFTLTCHAKQQVHPPDQAKNRTLHHAQRILHSRHQNPNQKNVKMPRMPHQV